MNALKVNSEQVWILEEGHFYNDRGLVVCAARTKKSLLAWIKENYPNHKRVRLRDDPVVPAPDFIFFETKGPVTDESTWLRSTPADQCPLI